MRADDAYLADAIYLYPARSWYLILSYERTPFDWQK